MATYIPGVTDFIPQIQEFQPDFNFYSKALDMKQGKFDANRERLSNLYGSLLNSPMLRDKNIEERDQFFKIIDQDIKRMSSMDLSKQQNVDAASAVFNQMLDNDNIVKDMVWTKNWQKQHQRADGFRNCVDPEKCGGSWWEGGVNALNYQAQEFKNADEQEALNFSNARFTPYQDVMGKAVKLAKEADLNIKIDQKTGGYIVTTKNGPNLVKPLSSLFMGTLGKDPKIMEYYKTKAYVDRKGWINSNVPVYGSEEAASEAYVNEVMQMMNPQLKQAQANLLYNQENVSRQKQAVEQEIAESGTTPNSPLADVYRRMVGTEQEVASSLETVQEANGNMNVAQNNRGTKAAMQYLDSALASSYLQGDIGAAAETLAYKDFEQTMKVDPYAIENVRQANRLTLEDRRFQNRAALEKYRFDLKDYDRKREARGDATSNLGILTDIEAGGVQVNLDEAASFDQFMKRKSALEQQVSGPEREMLSDMMTLAVNASNNGDAGADADLLTMGDALVQEVKADDPAFLNRYNNYSPEQKLKAIKSLDYANDFQKLPGSIADELYDDVLTPMMDMNNKDNQVTRKYMSQLWSTQDAINKRTRIEAKSKTLDQLDKYYANQTASVKAKIKADNQFWDHSDAIDAYIDKNGNPKSKKQFMIDYGKQMLKNNPERIDKERIALDAAEEAAEIYDNMNDDEGVLTLWKQAFAIHGVAEGQTNVLHGGGSMAAEKALNFPTVDPAEYMSNGTIGVNTYINDVKGAGAGKAKVALGRPSAGIPEESSAAAEAILNQIQADMRTRNKASDKSRPVLNATYQNIAGSNDEWTALNIKIDDVYAKQYVGSEKNPGLLYDRRNELQTDGITLYLKKDAATNLFYKNAKTTDVETILEYTGEYKIDEYPGYTKNTKITPLQNGGHMITGNIAYDLDENGNMLYQPFVNQYNSPDTDVNTVLNRFRQKVLVPSVQDMVYKQTAYNLQNGIKNPNELLR